MTQLTREQCIACRADSPQVSDEEIANLHPLVNDWQISQEDGIKKLDKLFVFRNFAQSLVFTNIVSELAENEGHHPRLVTEWGRATVTWWTHKIRGLHRNDFIMAAKTDEAYRRMVDSSGE